MLLPKTLRLDQERCGHCHGKGWLPTPESLRAKREKTGLTLTEVAERMGIAKSRLSSLETGRWDWNADLVEKYMVSLAALKKGH